MIEKMDNKDKEFPSRKTPRLENYDYGLNATYFITICTLNRKNILSAIKKVGNSIVVQLSSYGRIADRWIQELPNKYPGIKVNRYVIMPDHIHILFSLSNVDGRGNPSPTVDRVIGWLKYQVTKEINKLRNTQGEKIFQRSFYDHIARNASDCFEIHKYIYENPMRWYYDELNPEDK